MAMSTRDGGYEMMRIIEHLRYASPIILFSKDIVIDTEKVTASCVTAT